MGCSGAGDSVGSFLLTQSSNQIEIHHAFSHAGRIGSGSVQTDPLPRAHNSRC